MKIEKLQKEALVQQNQTTHKVVFGWNLYTSPLFKIFYQRGGSKISYHLLVICITIRERHVFANCDISLRMTQNHCRFYRLQFTLYSTVY